MLKINPISSKTIKRHLLKNTASAKQEKLANIATASALGLAIQLARVPLWELYDVALTSVFGTMTFASFIEMLNNKKKLDPIKKRAKSIKKAIIA